MEPKNFKVTPDIYASKGKRFANLIIDYIIQVLIGGLVGMLIGLIINLTDNYELYEWFFVDEARWKDYLLGIIILLVYFIIIESLTAHSIGKYITKTKIVMEDGSKPQISDIILRSLCRLIPFEQFSFLGDEARGWHDSMSNTYVVDEIKLKAKIERETGLELIGKSLEEIDQIQKSTL
ncbi:RDD family protein [uncultured Lacinutrix sp.]|uniref:RDD family protein n=1 Tax=uncultured Lacinutrix sp. TaxID=574032 RepID=UPI0026297E88|nr:RDD family protein [uncultured Lacinutrix sp.]